MKKNFFFGGAGGIGVNRNVFAMSDPCLHHVWSFLTGPIELVSKS